VSLGLVVELTGEKLTLIVRDQDEQEGQGNLPAAELTKSSKQSINRRVSDDLRVLCIGQGRREADVGGRSHDVEFGGKPSLGVLSAVRSRTSIGDEVGSD
jgi:hypothetical protein